MREGTRGWRARRASCTSLPAIVMRSHLAGLTFAAVAKLVVTPVAAQSRVEVPAGCGSQVEFQAELTRLLGSEASKAEPYSLNIALAEAGPDYRLRLTLRGEERELSDPDCRTLFKSAIVVAATSVKPDLAQQPATEPRPPPPSAPAEPGPSPSDTRPRQPWRAGVGAGAGGVVGLVPELAPVLELDVFAERDAWGGVVSLRHVTLTATEAPEGRGVEVRAYGGRAAVLYRPLGFARLSAGVEAHLLVGRGTGVATPLSDAAWCLAPSLELAAILLDIDSFRLELGIEGRWALLRPRFEIEGVEGDVYRVPAVGGVGIFRGVFLVF